MRIVYVGSPQLFQRGASAIHVMKMCQALARIGMEVELVLPSYNGQINIFEYYNVEPNFKLTTFPSVNDSSLRHIIHGAVSAVYTKLKREKFDLVLTRNILYTYLSTKFFKIRTIYDAHHPPVGKLAEFLFKSFKDSRYLVRFSTNSQGLADTYLKLGLPEDKLAVAPNGVDLERFQAVLSKDDARKQVGLPVGKKIVCYAGNLYVGRGINLLIEVALRLKDVLFVIVGGVEEDINRYMYVARMKSAENVIFIGFVPHKKVSLYLSSADVLVMPYTSQMTIKGGTNAVEFTSPIKLFEYMAARRPIVATSLPSVEEILEQEGNAVLVEPDSVDSLYYGIKRVLDDEELARDLSFRAVNDITKYTWEERARKILEGL